MKKITLLLGLLLLANSGKTVTPKISSGDKKVFMAAIVKATKHDNLINGSL